MAPASTQPVLSRAVAALLAHAIDYAGLYPPAALTMADAVREYGAQRSSPHAWALGRFVLAASQLDAFVAARQGGGAAADVWPLSVLSTGDVARDVALIAQTADANVDLLTVESVEARAESPAAVAQLAPLLSIAPEVYVEVPVTGELLPVIRSLGARAKMRTGGVTPDAFPPVAVVARFMRACVEHSISFKATAGLHHLVRGEYPLTYEAGSQLGTMFGFLNVFFAAALAQRGAPADAIRSALEERDAAAFEAAADGAELSWRGYRLTSSELTVLRASALASFGSCSFREPIAELAAARLGGAA